MEKILDDRGLKKTQMKLDNLKKVLSFLKNPEKKLRVIHVGGTNGKGSTSHKIASALLCEYNVALFTSPHIFNYQERIKVNDKLISEDDFKRIYKKVENAEKKVGFKGSFFEVLLVVAILYFVEKKVDFAVFEVGIGGKKDATNVLDGFISIITSISLDHTEILGNTLEKIAKEKAGIIKKDAVIVLGSGSDLEVIKKIANKKNSKVLISKRGENFDICNENIARITLEEISKKNPLKLSSIEYGIKKNPRCRFEIIQKNGKTFVLDVAHNEEGFLSILKKAKQMFKKRFSFLVGMSMNKDIESCAKILSSFASHIYVVDCDNKRLLSKKRLFSIFSKFTKKISYADSIKKSLEIAIKKDDIIFICGSFYIMEEAIDFIENF